MAIQVWIESAMAVTLDELLELVPNSRAKVEVEDLRFAFARSERQTADLREANSELINDLVTQVSTTNSVAKESGELRDRVAELERLNTELGAAVTHWRKRCDEGAAHPAPPAAPRPSDDALWDQTLTERDNYHEWADRLAYAIAARTNVDIGEHSNANNPWALALEAINSDPPAVPDEPLAAGWVYCPECGSDEKHYEDCSHYLCKQCGQDWYSEIDYIDVVRRNLAKRLAPPAVPGACTEPPDDAENASLLDHGYKRGWNACRDFMLASAPKPGGER